MSINIKKKTAHGAGVQAFFVGGGGNIYGYIVNMYIIVHLRHSGILPTLVPFLF